MLLDKDNKPTSFPNFFTDRTALVSTLPIFYGGLENKISFKGVEFSFLFQFTRQVGAKYLYYTNFSGYPGNFFRETSNQPSSVLLRWQKPGDIAPIARYNADGTLYAWPELSDAFYTSDASYIRLKNLSLSYELPDSWKRKMKMHNCRLYIQCKTCLR